MLQSTGLVYFDKALEAIRISTAYVSQEHRQAVAKFLEATAAEDEWLNRKDYIDGSAAGLMRSMICEHGSKLELLAALDLYRVRPALQAFVAGADFPHNLRQAAEISLKYWRCAIEWRISMLASLPERVRS